MLSFVNTAY